MSRGNQKRRPRGRPAPNARQQTDVELAERDATIWDLKLRGESIRAIAAQVELAPSTVHAILTRGYEELIYPKVEQARHEQLTRLDNWLTKLAPAIDEGDVKSIAQAVKIEDRRARLLGLDAPTKIQAEVEEIPPRPELLDALAAAQAVVAAREAALKGET